MSTQTVVSVTFSEAVEPASISLSLRNQSGDTIVATVTYDDVARSATLRPANDLAGATTFAATASARDIAGNTMSPVTWFLSTATPSFQQSIVFAGLTEPTAVDFASDGRVFVAEKSGLVKVFDDLNDSTPTIFADLRTNVYNYADRGLLGMALHPNFPTVPYVYVLYTADADINGTPPKWGTAGVTSDPCPTPPGPNTDGCVASARLSRLQANGNVMTGAEQVMIHDWFQQYPSHSIGSLLFGPDGALYASGGESASYAFVDYGQAGSPTNPGGDPPVPVGGAQTPPTAEGGALRAQDLLTSGDPVTLDGAIIRIDPETAAAPPDNPLFQNPDPNGRRIVAHGFRNPFRMTARPGTREIWVGDVGWNHSEEIDRIVDATDATVDNFGWPCYEGSGRQGAWASLGLTICEQLYASNTAIPPYYSYLNNEKVVDDSCPTGSSSTSGLAFYETGSYPSTYRGALFFADYSRNCIWVMFPGAGGVPDPATRASFLPGASSPVQLKIGAGGDLFYVDLVGTIRRVRYFSGNQPPRAAAQATPAAGSAPLLVTFDASGSSDPDADGALSYAWDLDGDGLFNDSTAERPTFTYSTIGPHTVRVRVTDTGGLSDTASVVALVDASYPTASILQPVSTISWNVADLVTFSGTATDKEDGTLPASAMTWNVILHHCPGICHVHPLQTFEGVSNGSFAAPDHEYPSHMELRLTVRDSTGLQDTKSVLIHPRTVDLTFASEPPGLQLTAGSGTAGTPLTRTVIVGSANSMSAPSPQGNYQFSTWSDGGPQTHSITAPAVATTLTASFTPLPTPPSLVAAYDFDDGAGTTAADRSGNGHTGTLNGVSWVTTGRFGRALSFNGTSDWVTVADANALDFTNAMTVEAWVRPTAPGGWRTVVLKENGTNMAYALYAHDNAAGPASYAVVAGREASAAGTSELPLNTWSHLATTYDGGTLRTYVNGTQVRAQAVDGSIVASTGSLRIGGNAVWVEYFSGLIDEVRLYNRALAAAEIATDMNSPITPSGPDTTAPTVTMTAPLPGPVSGSVDITANANDNVGVASVQFKVDGANLGAPVEASPYRVTWDTTTVGDGGHALTAAARDAAGNETLSDPVNVTIFNAPTPPPPDITPPSVALTSPAVAATVSGPITVAADATDNVRVSSVQFRLNDANLGAPDTSAPYTTSWDTSAGPNGLYAVTAIATDSSGNTMTSASVNVTVSNMAVPSGLVAAYAFDEAAGTTVADATGNGITGTVSNATWNTSGRFGGSLSFNGTDARVNIADHDSLDLTNGMTIEAWVYPTALLGGWRTVILKEDGWTLAYALYAHDNTTGPAGYVYVNTPNDSTIGSEALPLNTWTHLAVTYDGSLLHAYVNGALAGSQVVGGSIRVSTGDVRIGSNAVWGEYFSGSIDEVRIYNRPLSATELQSDMNTPVRSGGS